MTIRLGWSRGKLCFVVGWIAFKRYPAAARALREAKEAILAQQLSIG